MSTAQLGCVPISQFVSDTKSLIYKVFLSEINCKRIKLKAEQPLLLLLIRCLAFKHGSGGVWQAHEKRPTLPILATRGHKICMRSGKNGQLHSVADLGLAALPSLQCSRASQYFNLVRNHLTTTDDTVVRFCMCKVFR